MGTFDLGHSTMIFPRRIQAMTQRDVSSCAHLGRVAHRSLGHLDGTHGAQKTFFYRESRE